MSDKPAKLCADDDCHVCIPRYGLTDNERHKADGDHARHERLDLEAQLAAAQAEVERLRSGQVVVGAKALLESEVEKRPGPL